MFNSKQDSPQRYFENPSHFELLGDLQRYPHFKSLGQAKRSLTRKAIYFFRGSSRLTSRPGAPYVQRKRRNSHQYFWSGAARETGRLQV